MKGLLCYIYRDEHEPSSLNLVSSRCKRVTLIGAGIDGPFEPTDDAPAVVLRTIQVGGTDYVHARPLDIPSGIHSMFGGCFIYTSDSRFPSSAPIKLHDRVE